MDGKGRSHCHYDSVRFYRVCVNEVFISEVNSFSDGATVFFRNVGSRTYFRRMQRSSGRITINNESLGKLKTGCIFYVDVHTHCTST
jgi:hypothetical protein